MVTGRSTQQSALSAVLFQAALAIERGGIMPLANIILMPA
jgi:hypothetical protein